MMHELQAAAPAAALRVTAAGPRQIDDITALQRAAIAAVPERFYDARAKAAWWRTPAKGLAELIAAGRYRVVMGAAGPLAGAGWQPGDEPGTAVLRAVFVDPAVAGRGLGAGCVARVEAEVRAQGYRRLRVPAALSAVGFYARLGCAVVGSGEDEVEPGVRLAYRWMEKDLALAPTGTARSHAPG